MTAFERSFRSTSADETLRIATEIGRALAGGETIALVGELGSGKTVFARGLALGLGLRDPQIVSSPTYVLEQVYPTRVPMHHIDVYRLASEEEFRALGLEEHIKEGAVLAIEWGDKVLSVLPEDTLRVELTAGDDSPDFRMIHVLGTASAWEGKLASVAERLACV